MSRLERLAFGFDLGSDGGDRVADVSPIGLTEEMVMAPPEPLGPPPLFLVLDPVRLVALLTVRSTTLFGFGTCETPHLCWVCSFDYYAATSSAPNSRR